jgi:N-acyl homoserine lactone hydrolase
MHSNGTATRMWALHGPTLTIDVAELVLGGTGKVTVPVPSFVIQHPRGLVLFDTGFAPDALDDPRSYYPAVADIVTINIEEQQLLVNQLDAIGFSARDVTHVVVSHAHYDHTGGLYLFPQAKFYIGTGDLQYAFWPSAAETVVFRRDDLDKTRGFDWHQVPGDLDLFGDGSVVLLHMPGHTPGNKSLLVRLPSRTFLLAGDTVHLRAALNGPVPTPWDYSTSDARTSIDRLITVRDSLQAELWISHDPEDGALYKYSPPSVFE